MSRFWTKGPKRSGQAPLNGADIYNFWANCQKTHSKSWTEATTIARWNTVTLLPAQLLAVNVTIKWRKKSKTSVAAGAITTGSDTLGRLHVLVEFVQRHEWWLRSRIILKSRLGSTKASIERQTFLCKSWVAWIGTNICSRAIRYFKTRENMRK